MLISKTIAVGAIAALLSLGAAGAAFAAGEAEAGASGVVMSAPGVLPIVEETVTLHVAAIPHATVEDLTTNYATEWLEQQTGVHVEWNLLPRNDARQKINLMLTSATDLPDVFLGSGAITPEQATLYGGQGLFLPLNDFIDQYSTEVKRFFEENPLIEKVGTSPDGNIYSLGNYDLCYHCYYSQRVWYNKTWLETLGLAVPQTTEELYAVLTAFKNQDPNGNGRADEVPFTGATTGWRTTLDGYLMNPFEYNDGVDRLYLDGGNVVAAFMSNGWRDGLRYMNRLYGEGLIDQEGFTQDQNQLKQGVEGETVLYGTIAAGVPAAFSLNEGEATKNYYLLPPVAGPNDARQKINLMLTSATDLPDVFLGAGAITPEQATLYGGQVAVPATERTTSTSTAPRSNGFDAEPCTSIEQVGTSPDGNIYSLGNYDLCYHCYYSQRVWYNKTWLDRSAWRCRRPPKSCMRC